MIKPLYKLKGVPFSLPSVCSARVSEITHVMDCQNEIFFFVKHTKYSLGHGSGMAFSNA